MKKRTSFIYPLMSLTLVLNSVASTVQAGIPDNQSKLGAATYITMPVRQLANPMLIYVNRELMLKNGLTPDLVLKTLGYAAPIEGEASGGYNSNEKTAYVDGNGGIGMNDNLGSGRAAIIDERWQIKGSGRTPMVSQGTDAFHRNGAAVLGEAIHEAIWANLLGKEMPYGAHEVLALISTGTMVNSGGYENQPRVLIVRQDPVRPGHFVINDTAEKMNDPRDAARVKGAMARLVNALPQPKGFVAANTTEKFLSGINEFIDRQAIQHGYAWAHSMFHGATTPTNEGMDGRLIDFGTFSVFDAYPKIKLLDDDGYSGESDIFKSDLLKNVRDSWVKTLSPELLKVLPSERYFFDRFDSKFLATKQSELVRLAGGIDELSGQLMASGSGVRLGAALIKIANVGNEKHIEGYKGETAYGRATYSLPKILAAVSLQDIGSFDANNSSLVAALPDAGLRSELASAYVETFTLQQKLATDLGLSVKAESHYRRFASLARNKKMTTLFRQDVNESKIWKIVDDFRVTPTSAPTQTYIDKMIADNRRDFHDAAPYSIVLRETTVDGKTSRVVYDAKSDSVKRVVLSPLKLSLKARAMLCKAIFK